MTCRYARGGEPGHHDEAAQAAHGASDAVHRFEAVYAPELASGPVVFVDYQVVAEKQP